MNDRLKRFGCNDRFASDKQRAHSNAKEYLDFIFKSGKLSKIDKSGEVERAMRGILNDINSGNVTGPQLSYVDKVYERVMKAMGFPSIGTKHDPKKQIR